LKTDIEIQLL